MPFALQKTARLSLLAGLLAGVFHLAAAAADEAPRGAGDPLPEVRSLPSRVTLGFERVALPGGEHMGLLGVGYLVELSSNWWLGPSGHGAASGQRGGLFTWGLEGQRHWAIAPRWRLVTGLYVGGGGGAAAPVGGGLMLRPHADLMRDFGGWSAGLSVSHVRFPSGTIGDTQAGIQLAFDDRFAFTAPGLRGRRIAAGGPGGLGIDRVSLIVGRYGSGPGLASPLDHVGLRLEKGLPSLGRPWSFTVEADGAAAGGSDGYAEMGAGLQALWPVAGEAFSVGGHAALGLAGGGGVPTGGGTVGRAGVLARVQIGRQFSVDVEGGRARSFGGDFHANYARLGLGMTLNDDAAPRAGGSGQRSVHDMQWEFSVQDYLRAQRKTGAVHSMGAVGLKFRRALDDHLYLTGQAHSAITGGAGAYSAGLVGVGADTRLGAGSAWSLGAEALLGAAGGGGVDIRGGAIAQPMAWLGRDIGRHGRLKAGAGWIKSARGGLSSPVADLTAAWAFGVP